MDCSCTQCCVFLSGVRGRHNSAPNLERRFLVIFSTLRKDSVANYAWIWTLFSLSVAGPEVLYNALNASWLSGAVGRWRHKIRQVCGRVFPNRKKSAAELCQILRIVKFFEWVVNAIHLIGIRVTISCRYCIAFQAMLLLPTGCR